MKRRAVIERAIGETRAAVYEGRKLVELHMDRWSTAEAPKIGEVWTGQITSIDPSLGGAFVSLGTGPDALLAFKAQRDLPRLTEGETVDITIAKEAIAEKGPSIRFHGPATHKKPASVTRLSLTERLSARFPDLAFEETSVGAHDGATDRQLAINGGGTVTIERTQALIAIDVDKGSAPQIFECAMKATTLIMTQLRLRGLGGLIAIDYPNLRQPKQRAAIIRAIEAAADSDPANIRVAPFSRFGVVEMTRGQDGLSLDAKLNDRFGRPTPETLAIRAVRQIEREAKANRGARLNVVLTPDLVSALDAQPWDWKEHLTDRIGARFDIAPTGETFSIGVDR